MFDTANARRLMVEGQVRTADVTDVRVLDAMSTLPRERFLPPALAQLAYVDGDIPVARGRSLLKPMVLAKLVQAARIGSDDRVLDVGCATGYSSALLARLAGLVIGLEEDASLAGLAREALAAVGARNVEVVTGSLITGWLAGGPYDVILLNGSTEITPEALGAQLKANGRLLGIHGSSPASKAMIYYRTEGHLLGRPIFDATARLLPGFAAPLQFVF